MHNTNLSNIAFPVYRLGENEPTTDEGVTYFLLGKDTKYSDAEYKLLIVDDKNRPEPTMGLRRLALKAQGEKLYPMRRAIFFLADLVKVAKGSTWFIDSEGKVFKYQKSTKVPLIFRKITKVLPIASGGAIIEVESIASRYKILFAPTEEQKYAGLLVLGNSYVLYGLYDKLYDKTVRAI